MYHFASWIQIRIKKKITKNHRDSDPFGNLYSYKFAFYFRIRIKIILTYFRSEKGRKEMSSDQNDQIRFYTVLKVRCKAELCLNNTPKHIGFKALFLSPDEACIVSFLVVRSITSNCPLIVP